MPVLELAREWVLVAAMVAVEQVELQSQVLEPVLELELGPGLALVVVRRRKQAPATLPILILLLSSTFSL